MIKPRMPLQKPLAAQCRPSICSNVGNYNGAYSTAGTRGCTHATQVHGSLRVTGGVRRPGLGDLIMIRVIAVVACGFTLAACSVSMPDVSSFSLPEFMKSSPPQQALRIESEPSGAEAKSSSGQSCRTPCELSVAAADDVSLTVALNGYQPQTVAVRKDAADSSRLAPNPIHVELQPMTPAKKVAGKRKPAAVAAKPAPAQAASAQPAQAPAAAPPAVEASATGAK